MSVQTNNRTQQEGAKQNSSHKMAITQHWAQQPRRGCCLDISQLEGRRGVEGTVVWPSETQSNKLSGDAVGIPLAPGNMLLKIILTSCSPSGGRKILNWGEVFTPGGNMQNPAQILCV